MIQVMNALMESHAFAKYGIWYSEWLGQRAAGTEQVHRGGKKKKTCIWITERQFKSMQKDFQYSSHISVTKQ